MGSEKKRAVIISAICFLVAMLLISGYLKVRRDELTREFGEEVDVVVAKQGIGEYDLLRPDLLEVRPVFKAFRQPQTASRIEEVVGKSAFIPIYAGEQITFTKLVHQDGRPVLDRQLSKSFRALTLAVSASSGVSKLIRPGNRVDVLIVPHYEKEGSMTFEVKTLLQNVLVLATGKTIQNAVPSRANREVLGYLEDEYGKRKRKDVSNVSPTNLETGRPTDEYNSVTLQVTPEDAEKLHFMETVFSANRIVLTMRNSADQTVEALDTTILDEVLGPESDYGASKRKLPPPIPPPPPRFYDSVNGMPVEVR